jgi:hypothetical protein
MPIWPYCSSTTALKTVFVVENVEPGRPLVAGFRCHSYSRLQRDEQLF